MPDAPRRVEVRFGPAMQWTVAAPVRFEGLGLHTGQPARVTVLPHEAGGLWFRLGNTRIPALASHVVDTRRCTTLGIGASRVSTVEHLLAALAAEEVESAELAVEGPEIPALDGSARPFVESLRAAGKTRTPAPRRLLLLRGPVTVSDGNGSRVSGRPLLRPGEELRNGTRASPPLRISAQITLAHPMLAGQRAWSVVEPDRFLMRIAPCRTFGLIEEVEALQREGRALGGSLDNALVVFPDRYSSPLRVDREPARHKILDLVGDLSLVGGRLVGSINGRGNSHRLNVQFAAKILELGEQEGSLDE